MTETINRIEEALNENWPVEASDIRVLLEEYKEQERKLELVREFFTDLLNDISNN